MKRFSEQFHTKSKSVSMSSTEKQELRERLVSYMEYHPLPAERKSAQKSSVASKSPVLHEAFKTVSIPFSLLGKFSAVAAVFVLTLVPFMAEQSVPGDALYAVKVQFNEEVRSTLTFDSYEKVEWETQRVNRRMAEARLLESEGRLTDAVEAEVAQAVRMHTQNARAEIQSMRAVDAEEAKIASIEFDSNLEAQAASLKEGPENAALATTQATSVGIVDASNLIVQTVDELRALYDQASASTTPSYDKLSARVEQNTTRLYELSEELETLNPNTKKNVTRRIQDINRSVEEAIIQAPENESTAQDILIDVLKRSQKLIVFMTDFAESGTIDIEKLVPVILTSDEEVAEITAYKKEIARKQAEIEASLSAADSETSSDFIEKIEAGLIQIEVLITKTSESNVFAEIKTYSIAAIELADDLQLVLEKNNLPVIVEPVVLPGQATSTASSTVSSSTTPAVATTTPAVATTSPAVSTSTPPAAATSTAGA
jgi:hypothetical protein